MSFSFEGSKSVDKTPPRLFPKPFPNRVTVIIPIVHKWSTERVLKGILGDWSEDNSVAQARLQDTRQDGFGSLRRHRHGSRPILLRQRPCLALHQGVFEGLRSVLGRLVRGTSTIFSRWSLENGFDEFVYENIFSRCMEERGLKKTRTKAGMSLRGCYCSGIYPGHLLGTNRGCSPRTFISEKQP